MFPLFAFALPDVGPPTGLYFYLNKWTGSFYMSVYLCMIKNYSVVAARDRVCSHAICVGGIELSPSCIEIFEFPGWVLILISSMFDFSWNEPGNTKSHVCLNVSPSLYDGHHITGLVAMRARFSSHPVPSLVREFTPYLETVSLSYIRSWGIPCKIDPWRLAVYYIKGFSFSRAGYVATPWTEYYNPCRLIDCDFFLSQWIPIWCLEMAEVNSLVAKGEGKMIGVIPAL